MANARGVRFPVQEHCVRPFPCGAIKYLYDSKGLRHGWNFKTRLASPKSGSNWVEIIEMNHADRLVPVKHVQLIKKHHQQKTRLYPANLFSASHRPLIYQIPTMSGPILEGNPILPCPTRKALWPPQNVWLEVYKWMVFDDVSLKLQKHRRLSVKDHVFGLTRLFSASCAPLLSAPVVFLPWCFSLIYFLIPLKGVWNLTTWRIIPVRFSRQQLWWSFVPEVRLFPLQMGYLFMA